jgi:hypothetical protein
MIKYILIILFSISLFSNEKNAPGDPAGVSINTYGRSNNYDYTFKVRVKYSYYQGNTKNDMNKSSTIKLNGSTKSIGLHLVSSTSTEEIYESSEINFYTYKIYAGSNQLSITTTFTGDFGGEGEEGGYFVKTQSSNFIYNSQPDYISASISPSNGSTVSNQKADLYVSSQYGVNKFRYRVNSSSNWIYSTNVNSNVSVSLPSSGSQVTYQIRVEVGNTNYGGLWSSAPNNTFTIYSKPVIPPAPTYSSSHFFNGSDGKRYVNVPKPSIELSSSSGSGHTFYEHVTMKNGSYLSTPTPLTVYSGETKRIEPGTSDGETRISVYYKKKWCKF